MWEDLRKEFVEMDPYGTGYISREEFKDVLTELCVHLSEFEINKLSDKFDMKKDGRYNFSNISFKDDVDIAYSIKVLSFPFCLFQRFIYRVPEAVCLEETDLASW